MHGSELRLFGAKAFPLLKLFDVLCRTEQVGTIFNVFGMTRIRVCILPIISLDTLIRACG